MAPPVSIEHVAVAAAAAGHGTQIRRDLTRDEEPAAACKQLLDAAAGPWCHRHLDASSLTGSRACSAV
ncbi:predicted protein [Mycobacterium tuberculosis T17]|nr:predicted protein [Mycobacterium tuberculosis T17]